MNNYQKAHPLELLLFTHCCLDAGKTSFTENGATVRVLPERSETILFFPIDKCNLGSHLWKGQEGKSICDLIVYYAKEDRRVLCFVELKKSRQELDDHAVMQVVSTYNEIKKYLKLTDHYEIQAVLAGAERSAPVNQAKYQKKLHDNMKGVSVEYNMKLEQFASFLRTGTVQRKEKRTGRKKR